MKIAELFDHIPIHSYLCLIASFILFLRIGKHENSDLKEEARDPIQFTQENSSEVKKTLPIGLTTFPRKSYASGNSKFSQSS